VKALISTAREAGYESKIITTVEEVNDAQKKVLGQKIIDYFQDKGGLKGKTVAVWGLAFKPNTDDMREAPSIDMKQALKTPVVFDGRNQYNPKEMKRMGFEYFSIGRLG
jgi:UDPglucose 6-dehydrogenase